MSEKERRLAFIREHPHLTQTELALLFKVSQSTIHNDLQEIRTGQPKKKKKPTNRTFKPEWRPRNVDTFLTIGDTQIY